MEAYRPHPHPNSPAPPRTAPNGGHEGELNEDVLLSYHWGNACGKDLFTDGDQGRWPRKGDVPGGAVDWSGEWHFFGVEWRAGEEVDWFVDGQLANSVKKGTPPSLFVAKDPMYMILNNAMEPWSDSALDSGYPLFYYVDQVTWCEPLQTLEGEGGGWVKAPSLTL